MKQSTFITEGSQQEQDTSQLLTYKKKHKNSI